MAAAEQIKSLIKSFGDGDESRFFATAMQIAASEARKGHTTFAQELKSLIEKAKKGRSETIVDRGKTISISGPKRELNDLIEVFHPKIKLNDMVLDEHVKMSLTRVVQEQRKIELLRKHNLTPRRKLLLTGLPGCGKTMTAQALAGELGLAVFIIRLDGLISKFMGESIAKLRMIFDSMEDHRGVYLFDEFDSIGTHRDQGQDVGEIKRVLNSFLINIEKDQSNSIVISATNLPESLDKALFRRFDDIIRYPLPDVGEIKKVLKKNLSGFSLSTSTSVDKIAKEAVGLSYSDIVRACEEAIKEMIIMGKSKIPVSALLTSIEKRKQ
ncbi:ATP-binding protein [Marinoscillum furvescens]|uniref:ATPase family protein associated with various cellular activities (AAA) n=1 Tax=Marinoscillum furvescens DSM 4134 TaxID=1122208 RepID=A0A3D9KY75_MARFU|nr:ATP-binding protein [Marinoscillum furvescens]RED92008.1 ATPase family protein associated with various cellular activities (AAA) [Marinoscillum furvescens DSM 4134]